MIGIIYNPKTNKGTSVERMKGILSLLDEKGIDYIYRESEYAGHSIVLAKELAKECDILVPSGGDGTVYEVVNGALDEDVRFFPLPLGSGNDVCRVLNLHGKSDEELIGALIAGKECDYDYGFLNGKYAMLILLSYGASTDVTYQCSIRTGVSKHGYYSTLLKAFFTSRPKNYHIRTDSGEKDYFADFVSLQNLCNSGGGMILCNDASECDGKLDLVVAQHRSLFRKVLNLLAINAGKLPKQPNIITEKVTFAEIIPSSGEEIYCIDGELARTDRMDVIVGSHKLRFIHNR